MKGLERWHHVMEQSDMDALFDLLHPHCVFLSPVVHTTRGRVITCLLTGSEQSALGGLSVRTRGVQDNHAILEFTVMVDVLLMASI